MTKYLNEWSTTAGSNNFTVPDGWPEGMTSSQINNTARETLATIARWEKDTNGSILTTGTQPAYVVTLNQTSIAAYYDGLRLCVDFHAANTSATAPTVNVNAIGAKNLVYPDGTAVAQNDIVLGMKADIVYDGTNFQMLSSPIGIPTPGAAGTVITSDGTSPTWAIPDLFLIASGTVSAAASLDITDLTSTYAKYILVFDNLLPASDAVDCRLRLSNDNGATFRTGATDYARAAMSFAAGGSATGNGTNDEAFIDLHTSHGNTGGAEESSGVLEIINPTNASDETRILFRANYTNSAGNEAIFFSSGKVETAEANDAFQIYFQTGNISTMTYKLYGLRAT